MHRRIPLENWPFLLFVASLPFPTLLAFRVASVTVQLSDLLLLASGAAWLAAFAARRRAIMSSRLYLFAGIYAIAVILSAMASADTSVSAVKLVGKFFLIAIALVTLNSVASVRELRHALTAWVLGAAAAIALSIAGVLLFYAGVTDPSVNLVVHPYFGSLPSGNYPRIEGFFFYPAMLCHYLGITWLFAVILAWTGWIKARSLTLLSPALFLVNAFTLAPGLGGIFLSGGYLLNRKLREAKHPALGSLAMLGGASAAVAFLVAASFSLFSRTSSQAGITLAGWTLELSHRAIAWKTAFETFLGSPLFGRGIGLPVAYSEFTSPAGMNHILTDAHNTFLSLLGESGLAGFIGFIAIVGFLVAGLVRSVRSGGTGQMVGICLLAAMADAVFYQGLAGSFEDARHLWVLFGIVAAVNRPEFFAADDG